jgi:hypothetical protein
MDHGAAAGPRALAHLTAAQLQESVAFQVVEMVAWGHDLRSACAESGTTTAHFLTSLARSPTLQQVFAAARTISGYALEDEALALARAQYQTPGTKEKLTAARLLVDQLRWSAAKRNPQVFSERAEVKVTVPISIKTTLDLAGDGAQLDGAAGPSGIPNIYELRAEAIDEVEVDPDTARGARANAGEPPGGAPGTPLTPPHSPHGPQPGEGAAPTEGAEEEGWAAFIRSAEGEAGRDPDLEGEEAGERAAADRAPEGGGALDPEPRPQNRGRAGRQGGSAPRARGKAKTAGRPEGEGARPV